MPEVATTKAGWTAVAFGDVVRQVKDKVGPEESGLERYIAGEHMDTDDLRIRRWGAIGVDYLGPAFHMRFKPRHVLYGSRRTYLRKVALADFEGITANTTYVLESRDPDVLLPELLPFIMQTEPFHAHSKRESKGSVNPYVNFSDLASYEFLLPPLDEQRRIAEVLSAAESVVESLRNLKPLLHAAEIGLLENVMLGMPCSALVPVVKLLREPPRNGVSPSANSDGEGFKTVSISAVSDGLFDSTGCIKHAKIEADVARQFFVKRGDAFVIRGNGNRQFCGKVGLSNESHDELFHPDLLIRLRFDTNKILPQFAVAQWNLPSVHRRLSARAKSSNGIWKVNGQDIRAHSLFAPALAEQRRIMENLAALRAARWNARSREGAARRVKGILLHTAWGLDG